MRDSSLSACIQAIVAAEVGHLELAYDYFGETAFIDLRDLAGNTARRASTWPRWRGRGSSRWPGSAGCATTGTRWPSRRACPRRLTRLRFRLVYRGRRLRVEVSPTSRATSCWTASRSSSLHHGERFTLGPDAPDTRPLPALHEGPRPEPPPGRKPPRRHSEA